MTDTDTKTDSKTEREVTIKHGLFQYHAPELTVTAAGEEKEVLVQKLAFNGETVTLTRQADIARGEQHGAFYNEDELKKLGLGKFALGGTAQDAGEPPREVNLDEMDDEDISDWLTGTGSFDGEKKPNASEVVAAVGDNPGHARLVLDAEHRTGLDRSSVIDPLERVAAQDEE